jgi:D-galacturonate reductase
MIYEYADGREAAFDIHTSWVTPDNFPGYVEQEVQFRFDNGVWNGHSRKRGVELHRRGQHTPHDQDDDQQPLQRHVPRTLGRAQSQRGYGIEVIERFAREVAYVEFGGPMRRTIRVVSRRDAARDYNDLSADRQVVAAVEAMEAILAKAAAGEPNCGRRSQRTRSWRPRILPARQGRTRSALSTHCLNCRTLERPNVFTITFP